MTAFLEIAGLTKRHGARAALDAVSLSVGAGQFVALVGPSGSGKTTLLKSINRLVEPAAGTITLEGRDVRDLPLAELRHGIGYVIQSVGVPLSARIVRGAGAARRLRPGAGGGTEADADGRAVRRARPGHPRFARPRLP